MATPTTHITSDITSDITSQMAGESIITPTGRAADDAGHRTDDAWLRADRGARSAWIVVLIGVCYAVLANLTFEIAAAGIPAFFPAAGLTFAAMAVLPPSLRWKLVPVIIAAEVLVDVGHAMPWSIAIGFGIANSVEPLLAARLLGRWIGPPSRSIPTGTVVRFVAVAAAATAVGGAIGAAFLTLLDAPFVSSAMSWWTADLLGQLLVAPAAMLALTRRPTRLHISAMPIVSSCVTALACWFVFFATDAPLGWVVLPFVGFMAFRYGTPGAAGGSLIAACVAFVAVADGQPFLADMLGRGNGLLILHTMLVTTAFAAHLLAAQVNEARGLATALHHNEQALRAVIDGAPISIVELTDDATVVTWNSTAAETFGWTAEEVVGRPLPLIPREQWDARGSRRRAAMTDPAWRRFEFSCFHRDGTRLQIEAAFQPRETSEGQTVYTAILQDVTRARAEESQLKDRLGRDTLTGLANRERLVESLDERLDGATTDHDRDALALLFCDLDGFKLVNDEHGHLVGDRLLAAVGERLGRLVRPEDLAARLGGDEFVVLAGVPNREAADALARRVRESLTAPYEIDGGVLPITVRVGVSVGVAMAGEDNRTGSELLREADAAMYAAKRVRR